ncbi:MAG: hypothetical protein GY944_03475 [bacterium]|nr:hypothetical protein [bacterium]
MRRFSTLAAFAALAWLLVQALATNARCDSSPVRKLASPAAHRLTISDASEYWDLTIELEDGYRVMARFLITNQGPGKHNGTAVGHVISPDGTTTKFRNGRLQSGWTLSEDGLDLDIGKSHLDMHPPRYKLKVNKSDARIRIHFTPNALHEGPRKLGGNNYQLDLLALGARATGTIELEGMAQAHPVEGWATLTHTVARDKETGLAARRIEIFSQRGERPLYGASLLDPRGKHSTFLAWLEPGCDPRFSPEPFPAGNATNIESSGPISGEACLRTLTTKIGIDLVPGDAKNRPTKRGGNNAYWIPPVLLLGQSSRSIGSSADTRRYNREGTYEQHIGGRVVFGKEFLEYEALDDLPGPIRFLAGLSTRPRRVWSEARFEVTLPPTLDSKPISIQGQGVATVSFTNPVTSP